MKKVAKTILLILLIILTIVAIIISYFYIKDIKSTPTEEIKEQCQIQEKDYSGRKVFIITPKEEKKSEKLILYFHGGSYVAEASKKHWEFLKQMVIDTGCTVIMPDYPLTPKYTYVDVFNMIEPLYKEILENVEAKNLIVMGDSAGGGMALGLMEKISAQNKNYIPSEIVLLSPWLDTRLTNPKIEEFQKRDTVLNKETLKIAGVAYSGKNGKNSYLVNPIDGDISKLENITIFVGTDDILTPDSYLLQEKATEIGKQITIKEYKNAKHIWVIEKNSDEEITKKGYEDLINLIKESNKTP